MLIDVEAPAHSPFFLTSTCFPGTIPLPTSRATPLCTKPGTWRIDVDPAGGVAVDIDVRFRGRVGDFHGAPSPFTITQTRADRGCLILGACLP